MDDGSPQQRGASSVAIAVRGALSSRAAVLIASLTLFGLTFLVYSAALDNGFVWDDHGYLEYNPALKSFSALRSAFGSDANQGANPLVPLSYNYRPVTFASLYVNALLLGATARSFHIGNLILHAALALVLFLLLRQRLGQARPWAFTAAFAATCWWAFHPEQVETVVWASGRYDLLGTLLCVTALTLQAWPGCLATVAQGALIFLAVMAKESFVPMFAILAVDDWTLGRLNQRAIPKYTFLGTVFFLWQWIRFRAGTGSLTINLLTRPVLKLVVDYLSALAIYSWRALSPLPLSLAHTYRPVAAGIAVLVCVLLAVILVMLRRNPRWTTPFATFALMLVAVALILRPSGSSAERYFYAPSIGLAWLLALALRKAGESEKLAIRYLTLTVSVAVIAVDAAWVVYRTTRWKSDSTLFSEELDNGFDDWLGQQHMAVIEAGLGDLQSALSRAETARQHAVMAGATPTALAQVLSVEARIHLRMHNGRAALQRLQAAMKLAPGFPALHFEAAMAYSSLGDQEGKYRELEEALRLSPDFAEARIAMCRLKHSRRDFDGARRELAKVPPAAAASPGIAQALKDAADELRTEGKPPE